MNMVKTVVMSINGGSGEKDPPQVTYKQQPIKGFQATESCRHLGYWAAPNGDMTKTKRRVLAKTREVLGLLTHHPLETKIAKELPEHGGECVSILSGPGALESSRA